MVDIGIELSTGSFLLWLFAKTLGVRRAWRFLTGYYCYCCAKCVCVCAVVYRLYKLICFDQGSVFNKAEFDGSPPTDSPSSLWNLLGWNGRSQTLLLMLIVPLTVKRTHLPTEYCFIYNESCPSDITSTPSVHQDIWYSHAPITRWVEFA